MTKRLGLLGAAFACLVLAAPQAGATTAPDTEAKVAPFQFDYHRGGPRRGGHGPQDGHSDGHAHRCPGDQVVLRPEARADSGRYVRTWAKAMECVRPNGVITLIGTLPAPAGLVISKPVTLRGAGYALIDCGAARSCLSANLNFWDAVRVESVNIRHDGGAGCAFGTLSAGHVSMARVGVQSACGGPVVQASTRGTLRQVQVDAGRSLADTHAALTLTGGDFDLGQIAAFGGAAGLNLRAVQSVAAADVSVSGARIAAVLIDGVRRQAVFDRLTAADSRTGVYAKSGRNISLRDSLITANVIDGLFVEANAVRELYLERVSLTENGDSGLSFRGFDDRLRLAARDSVFSDNTRYGMRSDVTIRSRYLEGVRDNRLEGNGDSCTSRVNIDTGDNTCRNRRSY